MSPQRLAAALLPLLLASGAEAQVRMILPGDQVRVLAPAVHRGPFRGEVLRYEADTLAVREEGTDSIHAIPLLEIRRLARNEGMQRGRSLWRGVRVGAFLGGALGLVAGPLLAAKLGDDSSFLTITAASAGAGLAAGTSLGALYGGAFAHDRWQPFNMDVPPPSCGVQRCAPARAGDAPQPREGAAAP